MKETSLQKIVNHIDKDEIVRRLVMGISPEEVSGWLKEKYSEVGEKKLILSSKLLKDFKQDYLDLYKKIQEDCLAVRQEQNNIVENTKSLVQNNSAYRAKLQEYLDKEISIKDMVRNLIVAAEFRLSQIYDMIQDNPSSTKPDYVLIQWFNTLTGILEKQEALINGSPDKVIQQNTINIQILDSHINVFHKAIREVISRLDYDTSLLFVEVLNEELGKLRPEIEKTIPVDVRLEEAKKLQEKALGQLDIPSI